jgi:polyhydroxyalkanoate synthesis regulator phasin
LPTNKSNRPQTSNPVAKRTNVEIRQTGLGGNDFFQYETVTGTQLSAVNSDAVNNENRRATLDQVREMKQDLRSAHFNLGNTDVTYVSTMKQNMVSHGQSASNQSQKLAHEVSSKMQTVSYKIGAYQKRDMKDVASTYKQTISSSGALGQT